MTNATNLHDAAANALRTAWLNGKVNTTEGWALHVEADRLVEFIREQIARDVGALVDHFREGLVPEDSESLQHVANSNRAFGAAFARDVVLGTEDFYDKTPDWEDVAPDEDVPVNAMTYTQPDYCPVCKDGQNGDKGHCDHCEGEGCVCPVDGGILGWYQQSWHEIRGCLACGWMSGPI